MTTDPEPTAVPDRPATVGDVRRRGEIAFGGLKPVCAFFGWLAASGLLVLLTALLAATGVVVRLAIGDGDQPDADTVGWAGVVTVVVVVLVAYYAGGYVAGRMARFDGLRQGLGVFAWAVVAAIVVAILTAIGGARYDVLDQVNSFPRLPSDLSQLTLLSVVLLLGVVVAALVGALLGGLAGMRFHRAVDRAVVAD